MFERLQLLYSQGKISEVQLDNAISKGWITSEQKLEILSK